MDLLRFLIALLPLLVGVLFLWRRCVPSGAQRFTVAGYGMFLGMVGWGLVLRGVDALGLRLELGLLTGVALAGLALAALPPRRTAVARVTPPTAVALPVPERLLLVVLLLLLATRLLSLFFEVWWRPLFPWDALMHWATKARVWFEYRELLPFVGSEAWAASGDPRVFTDAHPDYPVTVPLLQLWMSISVGRWDSSLINLPWLACYLALGAAFYGQARQAGAGVTLAVLFTYFVLTLPLLNSHVALAGYADLYLGTAYALALMALHAALRGGPAWQWWLAAFCGASCLLMKQEGFFWMLTLVPALIAARWQRGWVVVVLPLMVIVVMALVLWLFPRDLQLAGHSLNSLDIRYREGALSAIGRSVFVLGNWHLGPWLLLMLLWLAGLRRGALDTALLPVLAALASAVPLFLFLFTSTDFVVGAIKQTAVGRIGLHLVPASLFLALLLYGALREQRSQATDEKG